MKRFKNVLFFFGLLDVISIVLLSQQVYSICLNYDQIPDQPLSKIRVVLLLVGYLSLFVSAAGLIKANKTGMITYYVQFPLRLVVWIFSFGFITYLSEYTSNEFLNDWIFRIVIILEFFRLYFTVVIHRKYFR